MISIRKTPDGVVFKVLVQPRSSNNMMAGLHDGALKLKLTAPPVDNAANLMCLKFLAKSPVTLRTKLSKKDGVTVQSSEQNDFLGSAGRAITDLRPSGVANIKDQRLDVVTRGEYLENETEIIVIAVSGNQIIVKQKE